MKILVISTSPRSGSGSLKAAQALSHQFHTLGYDASVVAMENCDIPMVGRGALLPDQLTPFQSALTQAWDQADCIVFTLPEYNWTNGGEFVNMIHQLGSKHFAHLFNHKTFAMAGVSAGRGGRTPAIDAHTLIGKIISFTGQFSVISPKILEVHEVHKNLDAVGNSTGNPLFDGPLTDFVQYTAKVATAWTAGVHAQV